MCSSSLPLLIALTLTAAAAVQAAAEDDTVGPIFLREPPNRVDFSNSTGAVVECKARGNPPPEIIWVRSDGTAVGEVPGLRQILANGNLVFPPFRAEDYRQEVHAQVYSCLAKNQVGTIHSRDVNVRAVVAQSYEVEADNEYVIRGNSAVMKCEVPSFVSDFVTVENWQDSKGNTYLPGNNFDSKYLVLPSGELHIKDVGPEDGYKSYQCRTKHRLTGETRLSATKGRLVITEPTGNVPPKVPGKKYEGGKLEYCQRTTFVVLTCEVVGYPVPKFRTYQ